MSAVPLTYLQWATRWLHIAERDGWAILAENQTLALIPFRRSWWLSPPAFRSRDAVRLHVRDQSRAGSQLAKDTLAMLKEHAFDEYIKVMGSDDE